LKTDKTENYLYIMVHPNSLKNLKRTAGPGRPKGGRNRCIETLDRMLAKAGNQEKLEKDLQSKFDNDPGSFMRSYVFPLLPKDINLDFKNDVEMVIKYKAQQLVESIDGDIEEMDVSDGK